MCFHNQKTQHDECLICLSSCLEDISFAHIVKPLPICRHCFNQLEVIEQTIDFHHHPLRILYNYNEFFRSLLYQYKGMYDFALRDVFFSSISPQFYQVIRDRLIVVAPSWEEDNKQRGFAPMKSIAETISSQVFDGIYKKEKYKQSDLPFEERKKVASKLGIRNGEQLTGKDVLILDDVFTSGSTLEAILNLVLEYKPKSIELLVIASKVTQNEERNLLTMI